MSSWIAAAKSKNKKNRRPDRNRNSGLSQPGKRQKQQDQNKIKLKPKDITCVNITSEALANDFRLPVSKYRTTLFKTKFCLPCKLYNISESIQKQHQTTSCTHLFPWSTQLWPLSRTKTVPRPSVGNTMTIPLKVLKIRPLRSLSSDKSLQIHDGSLSWTWKPREGIQ